jgi:hypothetical protein
MIFQQRLFAVWVLGIALLTGCGGDPLGRQALSGTVTVDGVPLKQGNLSLQPTEQQPTSSGAMIVEGKYTIAREQGLVPGKYLVSINAPVPGTGGEADEMPGMPPKPAKELIPAKWNIESEQFIEVKKEGPFVFDFEVKTK